MKISTELKCQGDPPTNTWSSLTLWFPYPWFCVPQVIAVLASLNSDLCLFNLAGLLASAA